jgi:hypothetical protein
VKVVDVGPRTMKSSSILSAALAMPCSTKDYTATAYFRCSVGSAGHDKQCPGGINRGKHGDDYYVGIDNHEFYIVPDAAIHGG